MAERRCQCFCPIRGAVWRKARERRGRLQFTITAQENIGGMGSAMGQARLEIRENLWKTLRTGTTGEGKSMVENPKA